MSWKADSDCLDGIVSTSCFILVAALSPVAISQVPREYQYHMRVVYLLDETGMAGHVYAMFNFLGIAHTYGWI